jgi:NAD(P)-dependent dehydrogenase (short-subunit alcohol dehydrogenase family)
MHSILKHRRALVTGGGRGIGAAIVNGWAVKVRMSR